VADNVKEPAVIGELLLYKVSDAVRVLRMSRAFIYKQIRDGRLQTVKQGGATFITAGALADYVALLETEAHGRPMDGERSERAS
jgi:hypothetical protein